MLYVAAALAKWRDQDGKHVEAIEKVGAKLPLCDHGREVAIGGGDASDICVQGFGAANPLECLLLEHPQ